MLIALAVTGLLAFAPSASTPLRIVFLAEDGTPIANTSAQADLLPAPPARGYHSGLQSVTDGLGQFLVLLPDERPWWVLVGVPGAVFFLDASKRNRLPETIKCWLGAKPSLVCAVEGPADKVALFLQLEASEWWVRLPPTKGGQLVFFQLPPGEHQLVVTSAHLLSYWSRAMALLPPQTVRVQEGQTTFVTIRVPATGSIKGRIVDPQQRPIPRAFLSLSDEMESQLNTNSDPNGLFSFDAVPQGTYRLLVTAEQFEAHERKVEVKANETVEVTVILKPQQFGIVRGQVVSEDGSVPQRGEILIEQILSPTLRQPMAVWLCQADGRFEGKLSPGTYLLTAQAGGRRRSQRVQVIAGKIVDLGKLVLPSPALVEGFVKSPVPLTNTRVRAIILRSNEDLLQPQWGSVVADVAVNPDGQFRLEVPAERLAIVLFPFGSGKTLWQIVQPKTGQRTFVQFTLPAMGAIEGQVVRADTGQPVVGAIVTLLDDAGITVSEAMTNRLGFYRFEPLLPGRYSLRCRAKGLAMGFRHNVRVAEGSRVPVDFVLSIGGSILGRVKTKQPQPLSMYVIVDADTNLMARVGFDGSFRIDHLSPGRHIVMLFRLGEQVAAKEVFVRSGETVEVVFELP